MYKSNQLKRNQLAAFGSLLKCLQRTDHVITDAVNPVEITMRILKTTDISILSI
jgi:hypothetical protein